MKAIQARYLFFIISCGLFFYSSLDVSAQLILNQPNTTGTYTAPHTITLDVGFSSDNFSGSIVSSPICTPLNAAPSSNQNYIVTYVPRQPFNDASSLAGKNTCEVMETIQYFDGLGRPMQTVQVKASPNLRDIVTPIAYDQFGRETTKYNIYTALPGVSDGSYKTNAIADQSSFYNNPIGWNAPGIKNTNFPFSQTQFEASPLNRPLELGATGDSWQLSANTTATNPGHTVKLDYHTNDATSLTSGSGRWAKLYSVNLDANGKPSLVDRGSYNVNTLVVTVYSNENWLATDGKAGTTEEYKDNEGHTVLKRAYNLTFTGLETLSTYYVYDDFGDLSFVLPPKAEPDNGGITQTVLENLCFQYRYDERRRIVESKIPSKGVEYKVYNVLDKMIASQDSMQRVQNKWTFIKYDALGRALITGTWNNGGTSISRTNLQSQINSQSIQWERRDNANSSGKYYTAASFPVNNIVDYLSVTYFDDYNIPSLPSTYDKHVSYSQMTRGLTTASLSNVLGTSDMLWTVQYYDDKGRTINAIVQHYLNGSANTANYDEVNSTYDFTNNLITKTRNHHAATNLDLAIVDSLVYDHMGRKTQSWNQIAGGTKVLLSKLDYNEVGQLTAKHLHSTDSGNSFLQDISYQYNERGWMTKDSSGLFVIKLKYDDGTTPLYNGNIANQYWGTGSNLNKSYTYSYDNLNRLVSGVSNESYTEQAIDYDKVGNIQHLTRIDPRTSSTANYTYNYNGNQLTSVTGLTGTNTYLYDGNGNTVFDAHNNVSIAYNILNLPQFVTGGKTVTYTYEADGQKLRRVSASSTFGSEDYIKGIQYYNSAIEFVTNEEGIARRNPVTGAYRYEYTLTDHLGNNRICFDDSSNVARVIQRDDYYPFGVNYNRYTFGQKNNYLYNKKEYQDELGTSDYGARYYDATIGRWGTVDPLAEKYYTDGAYNYVSNNPVSRIDPDGRDWRNDDDKAYAEKVKSDAKDVNKGLEGKAKRIQSRIDKANSGDKKFKDDKAKSAYIASETKDLNETKASIEINNSTINKIDEMTKSTDFTYGFNMTPGNSVGGTTKETQTVNGKEKTIYMMSINGEANGVHEMTHAYAATIADDYRFSSSGNILWGYGAAAYQNNADGEIEAYKAQFAFDSTGFPASTLLGKSQSAGSLNDINTSYVGGIKNPNDNKALYPNVLLKAVIMRLFGNGGQ
ncbi:MAG: DUF6443 domain-containing protein [Mucilaginibacter sp.]|uniref:DUF6443 domain-containing protein n=1 Tax=Mucilaginibacter sp. TaxID=1882438 RepID=UPI0032675D31